MSLRVLAVSAGLAIAATANAQSLTTLFSAGNGQAGAMFDLINVGSQPFEVTGWDYRLFSGGGPGILQEIEVYYSLGGYVGKETNPGAWSFLGTQQVETIAAPAAIHVGISGLTINPGERYGIYFTRNNNASTLSIAYTNGNGLNQVYENSEARIEAGVGKSYPFGSTFSPRVWNGTVYYEVIPAPSAVALLGLGGLIAARRRRA